MEQDELLGHIVRTLEEQEITYLLVGSLASGVYGEPRLTHDIDVVLELRPDQVAQLCAAFPAGDYYVSETAAREADRVFHRPSPAPSGCRSAVDRSNAGNRGTG